MYFNIVQPPVYKTVIRLHRVSFWPVELFSEIPITLELRGELGLNLVYLCILVLSSTGM